MGSPAVDVAWGEGAGAAEHEAVDAVVPQGDLHRGVGAERVADQRGTRDVQVVQQRGDVPGHGAGAVGGGVEGLVGGAVASSVQAQHSVADGEGGDETLVAITGAEAALGLAAGAVEQDDRGP